MHFSSSYYNTGRHYECMNSFYVAPRKAKIIKITKKANWFVAPHKETAIIMAHNTRFAAPGHDQETVINNTRQPELILYELSMNHFYGLVAVLNSGFLINNIAQVCKKGTV